MQLPLIWLTLSWFMYGSHDFLQPLHHLVMLLPSWSSQTLWRLGGGFQQYRMELSYASLSMQFLWGPVDPSEERDKLPHHIPYKRYYRTYTLNIFQEKLVHKKMNFLYTYRCFQVRQELVISLSQLTLSPTTLSSALQSWLIRLWMRENPLLLLLGQHCSYLIQVAQ